VPIATSSRVTLAYGCPNWSSPDIVVQVVAEPGPITFFFNSGSHDTIRETTLAAW